MSCTSGWTCLTFASWLADVVKRKGRRRVRWCSRLVTSIRTYTDSDHDFERLCARDDIDLGSYGHAVGMAIPVVLAAMNHSITPPPRCRRGLHDRRLLEAVDTLRRRAVTAS